MRISLGFNRRLIIKIEHIGLREKVAKMMWAFYKSTGKDPTKVYLSTRAEIEGICSDDIGAELYDEVWISGFRETLKKHGNTFLGLQIVWDAKTFKVE